MTTRRTLLRHAYFVAARVSPLIPSIDSRFVCLKRLTTLVAAGKMKRKAGKQIESPEKKPKANEYCDTPVILDEAGSPIWPAPVNQMSAARQFLREWYVILEYMRVIADNKNSAAAGKKTLIVPDKDADGLSSGVIVYRTLVALGLEENLLDVHLVQKGSNIHEDDERRAMRDKNPSYIIILDQGSRGGPPIVDSEDTRCLLIDHHFSNEFPAGAVVSCRQSFWTSYYADDNEGCVWMPLPSRANQCSHDV